MKTLISSLVVTILLLSGCGGSSETEDSKVVEYDGKFIDSVNSYIIKWNEIRAQDRKDEYETQAEFEEKIAKLIETEGVITYKMKLHDKYDIETNTLTIYNTAYDYKPEEGHFTLDIVLGTLYSVDVINMNYFPYPIEKTSVNYDGRIFYKEYMSVEDVKKLEGTFMLEIDVRYRKYEGYKSLDEGITYKYSNIFGTSININATLQSVRIYSSTNPDAIIEKYSIL